MLTEIASVKDPVSGAVTRVAWEGTLPKPTLEGRRATYESVEPGTDLVIEATSTGFEQFWLPAWKQRLLPVGLHLERKVGVFYSHYKSSRKVLWGG